MKGLVNIAYKMDEKLQSFQPSLRVSIAITQNARIPLDGSRDAISSAAIAIGVVF